MNPSQMVESYKFWDVVALWSREKLEHELVIARALARGVIVDGLRLHSVDPRWMKPDQSLTGYPYVGYSAKGETPPILLRAEVLEHLLAVVRSAAEPSRQILENEFLLREEFVQWLSSTGQTIPAFWARDHVLEAQS
jgi:hypothetical protein